LAARITSACRCCGRQIGLAVTSDLEIQPDSAAEGVLLFMPSVDWGNLSGPNIIPDY
jgi:hypothetical protein